MQRDYRFYIDKAKANQGFKYDAEIDKALGFKGSMTTMILKKGSHLSEEKMMELAALGGQSDIIALMDLQIMKNEGTPQQTAYKEILKRISVIIAVVLISISPLPAKANVNIEHGYYGKDTVYYGKCYQRFFKRLFDKVFSWIQMILLRGRSTQRYMFAG